MQSIFREFTILFTSFCITTQFLGCRKEQATLKIEIKALGAEGSPISGATVSLDNEKLGITNAFGTYSTSKEVSSKGRHKLAITKSDENYYYAPYVESIKLEPGQIKPANITATMYVIPKPKMKHNTAAASANGSITQEEISEKNTESPTSVLSHQTIDQNLPLLQFTEQDAMSTMANAHTNSSTMEEMFTVHVYSGRSPVHKASVKWFSADGNISKCETNERGRCIITVSESLSTNGSLLIQHEGYISQVESISPTNRSNVRTSLLPGRSVDIVSFETGPFSSKPLAEVDIRYDGITVAQTNRHGIAVFPLKSNLPISLTLEHPSRNSAFKVIINNYNNAKLTAKFSNQSTQSWANWGLFKTHVNKEFKEENTKINRTICEDYIQQATHSKILESLPQEFSKLAKDEIAILPIVSSFENKIQYSLQAFDKTGLIASSNLIDIRSPALNESWKISADNALNSLYGRLPWGGTVMEVKDDQVVVAINTTYTAPGDTLRIETDRGPETVAVSTVSKNLVVTKSNPNFLKIDPIDIVGSQVKKITPTIVSDTIRLENLRIASIPDHNLTMAKKYYAENNFEEAKRWLNRAGSEFSESRREELKKRSLHKVNEHFSTTSNAESGDSEPALNNVSDTGSKKLLTLQMLSLISNEEGNFAEALNYQREISKLAVLNSNNVVEYISKTNVMKIQAELLPSIANEDALIARLTELHAESEKLLNAVMNSPSLIFIRAHLEYIKLIALRKKAEAQEDLVTLATLSGLWESMEQSILNRELSGAESRVWRNIMTREKSRANIETTTNASSPRPM